jgi:hypothetical protein
VATVPADVESRRVAVSGSYAYVLGWRLQVVDVSNPESPEIVGFADMGYDGMWPWWLSDNFCVAVAESHAYVGLYTGAGGLHVVDISNPASPPTVGVVGTPGRPMDVEVSGSTAYVARLHAGLQVVDVSDPASPALVGSPYMRGSALAVAVSGSYAYVAAGWYRGCLQHESVPAPDGSEPGFLGQRDGVPGTGTRAGLQVFDVSDPAFPVRAGCVYVPDAPNEPENVAYDVAVSGSYAYVAATSGLHVVDISNPHSPTIVGSVPPESWGFPVRVAVSESHAYVVFTGFYEGWTGPTWLEVVDVIDPVSPVRVGSVEMPGAAWGVALSGSYAYIAGRQWLTHPTPGGQGGLRVVNISDPTSPEIVRTVATWCDYSDVVVSGGYAYVAAEYWGWFGKLHVWDISAFTAPEASGVVGEIGMGSAHAVTVLGDYVYVATEGGLRVFPIQCPQAVPAQAALASPGFTERDGRPGLHLAIPAPNPVSIRTELSFSLLARQHARLVLYDVAGRHVQTLVDRMLPEGAHSATWNARDHSGRRVAPGTYFARLTAGSETQTRKVVFLGGK